MGGATPAAHHATVHDQYVTSQRSLYRGPVWQKRAIEYVGVIPVRYEVLVIVGQKVDDRMALRPHSVRTPRTSTSCHSSKLVTSYS